MPYINFQYTKEFNEKNKFLHTIDFFQLEKLKIVAYIT